jgi:hypothetical protein
MNNKIHKIRKKRKRIGNDKLHKTKNPQPSFYVNNYKDDANERHIKQ